MRKLLADAAWALQPEISDECSVAGEQRRSVVITLS
jgi:hypothetical protein